MNIQAKQQRGWPSWWRRLTGLLDWNSGSSARLRPADMPPPYRRMLAINSDVEFTPWAAQLDLLRIFAERGLETSFSYWFFADQETTWSLFDSSGNLTAAGNEAQGLLRDGAFDTIHGFGGVLNGRGCRIDRERIIKAYGWLEQQGIRTRVFSNHGTTSDTQNIGGHWVGQPGTLDYQKGDVPGESSYHLDVTLRHGVRFFWTDIDRERGSLWFRPDCNPQRDTLFESQVSRDGNAILRFLRADAGVLPDAVALGDQIHRALDDEHTGYSILYTHLGVARRDDGRPINNPPPYLSPSGFDALTALEGASRAGDVLVTGTARLLTHALLMAARPWRVDEGPDHNTISFESAFQYQGVEFSLEWDDLAGICFECLQPSLPTVALLDGDRRKLEPWSVAGRQYVGFPWAERVVTASLEEALKRA